MLKDNRDKRRKLRSGFKVSISLRFCEEMISFLQNTTSSSWFVSWPILPMNNLGWMPNVSVWKTINKWWLLFHSINQIIFVISSGDLTRESFTFWSQCWCKSSKGFFNLLSVILEYNFCSHNGFTLIKRRFSLTENRIYFCTVPLTAMEKYQLQRLFLNSNFFGTVLNNSKTTFYIVWFQL